MLKIKHFVIQRTGAYCFALPVLAQSGNSDSQPSKLENLLWSVVPIVVIGLLVFWLMRAVTRGQQKHVDRYQQHMERVEHSLERIAQALEGRGKDTSDTKDGKDA